MDFERIVTDPESGYKEENLHDVDKIYLAGYRQAIEDLDTAICNLVDHIRNPMEDMLYFVPDEEESRALGSERDKTFAKIFGENLKEWLKKDTYEIIVSCIDSYEETEEED